MSEGDGSGETNPRNLSSRQRRELFLELAGVPGGTTVSDVAERARALGDSATEEAYHNIARRLTHAALLRVDARQGEVRRYTRGAGEAWLDERELADIVDPDYPIAALAIWREAVQNVRDIPESIWIELRERLLGENARMLFADAISSYCDDLSAQVSALAAADEANFTDLARARKEAEQTLQLLVGLTKYGLGLSKEAVRLPANLDRALRLYSAGDAPVRVNRARLEEELTRRIEEGPVLQVVAPPTADPAPRAPIIGAVDGSTRGGLLSVAGGDGDFNVAHAPLISINTAVGQVNWKVRSGRALYPAFMRLPERPEDMQREDNRHTVMAKLLHPDLTDAQYMHAVWNAMDLIETRATLRLLQRWYADGRSVEVPPADVVLRDGTVSPQDRDFSHYKQQDSYGRIVRDMIELSWRVALACREDGRTVCGVVKQTQLSVFAPVLNWYACKVARDGGSQLASWPMEAMNAAQDQLLVTRLLTAERGRDEPWLRTCIMLRPFHAVTNFGKMYSRAEPPAERILKDHLRSRTRVDDEDQDDRIFWEQFQEDRDPFVRMLREVQYANVFVAALPRLDNDTVLPRLEVLVVSPTEEHECSPWGQATRALNASLSAIRTVDFDVAAEHQMFNTRPILDVLPSLLISTHEMVKTWALELVGRVQEFVGYHLSRYVNAKRLKGLQIRPFTRAELEMLYTQLRVEREQAAGARSRNVIGS